MSSTQRGYARHKTDYYITPKKPIKEFFSQFLFNENIGRPDRLSWLDPCAGGDANNDMAYPSVIETEFGPNVLHTMDIREDSLAEYKGSYLETPINVTHDIIISNPPFLHAQEFIEKALTEIDENGYVIMLLRLNFWGSKKRQAFFLKNMPSACYIHSKRISFTEDGKTDSIEYAHFVWKKSNHSGFCKTYYISG